MQALNRFGLGRKVGVLELELPAVTTQKVRFAVSPAQELFSAVQAAARPSLVPALRAWTAPAARTLAGLGVDELIAALSGDDYAPDFLTPPPKRPDVTFHEQLEQAAATPPEQVAHELALAFGGRPVPVGLAVDGAAARDLLVEQFSRCWRPLLEPCWDQAVAILVADIDHRATLYAAGGVSAALESLHRSVRWAEGRLVVAAPHPSAQLLLDERGLLLIPSVLARDDRVGPVLVGYWQPSLVYPARGRALFLRARQLPGRELASLLGPTRAAVLEAIREPGTTTALSRVLGVAPSTVSEHLRALHRAGLCDRRRSGRSVVYRLTDLGRSLLDPDHPGPSRPVVRR